MLREDRAEAQTTSRFAVNWTTQRDPYFTLQTSEGYQIDATSVWVSEDDVTPTSSPWLLPSNDEISGSNVTRPLNFLSPTSDQVTLQFKGMTPNHEGATYLDTEFFLWGGGFFKFDDPWEFNIPTNTVIQPLGNWAVHYITQTASSVYVRAFLQAAVNQAAQAFNVNLQIRCDPTIRSGSFYGVQRCGIKVAEVRGRYPRDVEDHSFEIVETMD